MTPDLALRALADPTRRRLFERLAAEGALSVGDLARGAGVSQPAASKHLAHLASAGLVAVARSGRRSLCTATPAGLDPLAAWIGRQSAFWEERLDRLDDTLRRMDQ